jgi:RNA methyltransferase, TrmH family
MRVDKTIASASNPLFREWIDLLSSKGIKKQGLFLVAGEKAVAETLARFPHLARSLFVCADRHMDHPVIASSRASLASKGSAQSSAAAANSPSADTRFTVIALAKPLFDELDVSGTHAPLLLARTPEIRDADLKAKASGLEVLCALGDPANVGALLRSASAFGATKVILLKESASPFHPKAVRAASASTLLTKLERGPSIKDLPQLAEQNLLALPVLALDMHGKGMSEFAWPKDARLLIGEEGQGVPNSKAFEFLSIPMEKDVESLNATVAASVAMFSYRTSQTK